MGVIARVFSMFFWVAFPVKLIIWSLIIFFLFSVVAIKGLIINSGYYNSVRLQSHIEEKNDDFLAKTCSDGGFSSCMMVTSVFSKDNKYIVHPYSRYVSQFGGVKNISHPSVIEVDKDKIAKTNLIVLKSLRDGCVELERTTKELITFYGLSSPVNFTHSYICFKRNTYFTLFTKGNHCETCGVKLNEYFKQSSSTIYYGFESGFFDRTSRFFYDTISNFLSAKSERIKESFTRTAKKITRSALVKVSDDDYQKPNTIIEKKEIQNQQIESDYGQPQQLSSDEGQSISSPENKKLVSSTTKDEPSYHNIQGQQSDEIDYDSISEEIEMPSDI